MRQSLQERPPDSAGPPAQRRPGAGDRSPGRLARYLLLEHSVLLLSIVYFAAAWPFVPEMASGHNLSNLFMNMLPLLAVATGQTIVLITGGIDLSITSIIAMVSVSGAWVMSRPGGAPEAGPLVICAAIGLMLLVGLAIGAFNGVSVAVLGMPPFIVTLTTLMGISGLAIWLTQSRNIAPLPDAFIALGYGGVWGVIPYALLVTAALAVLAHLVLTRTVVGQWMHAVGYSARVARVSGVPVRRVTLGAYLASGLCAAVGSVLYTARLETGSPTLGRELLLDVVGAAVIGGTSLFGGRGKVLWTVYGVMLFALVANTLNLLGLAHFTIMMVKGGIILLAAALDLLRVRLSAGRAS